MNFHVEKAELRSSARTRVLLEARVYHGRNAVIPCMIKDISLGGARITFKEGQRIPGEFELTILGSDFRTVASELRWQEGSVAGVSFTKP